MNPIVFLVTTGSGDDGDAWDVFGIYRTREAAERAKHEYESCDVPRSDGSSYRRQANEIEEYELHG